MVSSNARPDNSSSKGSNLGSSSQGSNSQDNSRLQVDRADNPIQSKAGPLDFIALKKGLSRRSLFQGIEHLGVVFADFHLWKDV